MVHFKSLVVLCTTALAFAFPRNATLDSRAADNSLVTITTSSTGTAGGYYYSLWEQVNTGVTMNIGTGQYSLTWNSASQDVVAGIGWMPGSAQ